MPLFFLNKSLWFPPVEKALPDGLLAVGGDLSTDRLLLAYRAGIFPWYNEEDPPMWWSPDPRFVLFPGELKVSKSMNQLIKRDHFTFSTNTAFEQVIRRCSSIPRKGADGTWISEEIIGSFTRLHRLGYAHSAEAWQDGELAGGLYGLWMGNIFFGESMFSAVSNASKYAFICWVHHLKARGVALVDCQVYTPHLQSLGAKMIPRTLFMDLLDANIK
jgi:leucyl/phenylalanyl-tRNA--protein transferase